jgi:hypothetical protein
VTHWVSEDYFRTFWRVWGITVRHHYDPYLFVLIGSYLFEMQMFCHPGRYATMKWGSDSNQELEIANVG